MEIIELFQQLGADSQTVAASLKQAGISGIVGSMNSCPIAIFLRQKFPNEDSIWVNNMEAKVGDAIIKLPNAVQDFVYDFDHLKYKELEGN